MACVGIVGGLGVGATVHYYEKITAACKARDVVPDLVIAHADVDHGQRLVREGKLDALAAYLVGFIERMARAGAEVAVIPAVTPHVCIEQLKPLLPMPLIDIVETLASELRARRHAARRAVRHGRDRAGEPVGPARRRCDREAAPDEIAFIGQAYQRILDGRSKPADADGLRRIASDLQRRDGVETILLAGTDLAGCVDA